MQLCLLCYKIVFGDKMLGYIKVFKPELKIREYEVYRGVYCSLCRNLGRRYTPFAQIFLSYDFTLLALLILSLKKDCCGFEKCRCPYNLTKKCLKYSDKNIFDKCSDALIITVYYKILDNLHDRGLKNRLLAVLCFPFVFFAHKKASRLSPEIEKAVGVAVKAQFKAEELPDTGVDEAAHPTAEALSLLFALFADEENRGAVERFGYMTGRLVYMLDAADDVKEDIRLNNFNPFKIYYDENNTGGFAEKVKPIINGTANEMFGSFEKIKIYRYKNIFENILIYGIKASENKIFSKYNPKTVSVNEEEKQ